MSNKCFCTLTVEGDPEIIEQAKKKMASKDRPLDFRNIIPIPIEFDIPEDENAMYFFASDYHPRNSQIIKRTEELSDDESESMQKSLKLVKRYQVNARHYGCPHQKAWAKIHWENTDNAEFEIDDILKCYENTISFSVTNAPPIKILTRLSQLFPTLIFLFECHQLFQNPTYYVFHNARQYRNP